MGERPELEKQAPPLVRGARRGVYLSVAAVFFVLGVLGAMLPVLPATPFLLLTSYFLVRCSPELNEKLLRTRFVGPILVDWQIHRGVRWDVKVQAIVIVLMMVASTNYFSGQALVPSLAVAVLATICIIVVLRLPAPRRFD